MFRRSTSSLYGITLILTIVLSSNTTTASLFNTLRSFFGALPYSEIMQKKYPLSSDATLTLNNFDGNIKITTKKSHLVHLTAIKRANRPDMLPHLQISDNTSITPTGQHTALTISSVISGEHVQGRIDYELTIPAGTALNLATETGAITIDAIHAPSVLRTQKGSINVRHAYESVTASVEDSGAISIGTATHSVRATTVYGNINVDNAHKNVLATSSGKGTIHIAYAVPPLNAEIALKTCSGNITVALPEKTNAAIAGKTKKGCLTSDHVITFAPMSSTLDSTAWTRFRQEVIGSVGIHETGVPHIRLESERGNIKIAKNCVK